MGNSIPPVGIMHGSHGGNHPWNVRLRNPSGWSKRSDLHPIMVLILAHGKPQASAGNMYGMSEWESPNSSGGNHASHIMARECGWHASTWECEWGMGVLQLWMKNMCGMWPLVEGSGIPTLSMDMHVSMNELFTLNAFCNGNYAERVSEQPVWWYWD